MESLRTIRNNISQAVNTSSSSGQILFVFGVLITVYILVRIIFTLISMYFGTATNRVQILSGKISGATPLKLGQNPNITGDKPLMLSKNEKSGIEFTYSMWLNIHPTAFHGESKYDINDCQNFIDNAGSTVNCYAATNRREAVHVFSKGSAKGHIENDNVYLNGINQENNAPGVYLAQQKDATSNSRSMCMLLYMDTYETPAYKTVPLIVDNLPIEKWVNIILIGKQSTIYVYINGVLKASHTYNGVFKQNYDDININNNSAVAWGELSDVVYYNKAIYGFEIHNIISEGPNTNPASISNKLDSEIPQYFHRDWY